MSNVPSDDLVDAALNQPAPSHLDPAKLHAILYGTDPVELSPVEQSKPVSEDEGNPILVLLTGILMILLKIKK